MRTAKATCPEELKPRNVVNPRRSAGMRPRFSYSSYLALNFRFSPINSTSYTFHNLAKRQQRLIGLLERER